MTLPMMPHALQDGTPVSLHEANENLIAGSRDVGDNLSKRYTRSVVTFSLDGVTQAGSFFERGFYLPPLSTFFSAGDVVTIEKLELVIYAATGCTWGLYSSAHGSSVVLDVATAGATTRAYTQSVVPAIVSTSFGTFLLAGSAANTITSGQLIVHLKSDRGAANGVTSHAGYTPTLLTAASSTAGSTLDTELSALEAAVSRDTANSRQLIVQGAYVLRNIDAAAPPAATHLVWRLPAMGRTFTRLCHVMTAPNTATVTWTLRNAAGVTVASAACVGLGTGAAQATIASFTDTQPTDPTDANDDYTLTASFAGTDTVVVTCCYLLCT